MPGVKRVKNAKATARVHRKERIRKTISGTPERPRLSIFRSAKHIYAQAVDDTTNTILAAASDLEDGFAPEAKNKKDRAKAVGKAVAKKLIEKGVAICVFDRNGYIYHGRVSAVADGAREAGLKF